MGAAMVVMVALFGGNEAADVTARESGTLEWLTVVEFYEYATRNLPQLPELLPWSGPGASDGFGLKESFQDGCRFRSADLAHVIGKDGNELLGGLRWQPDLGELGAQRSHAS